MRIKGIASGLLVLLVMNSGLAQDNVCQVLRSKPTQIVVAHSGTPNPGLHREIIKKSMEYIQKILDLKFEAAEFIKKNKKVYGIFAAALEARKQLQDEIENNKSDRKSVMKDYHSAIKEINPSLPSKIIERIFKELTKQKDSDIKRINKLSRTLLRDQDEVDRSYFKALKVWGPFQKHLDWLSEIEKSLLDSLKKLKEIESYRTNSFTQLVAGLRATGFNSSREVLLYDLDDREERQRKCRQLLERLKDWSEELRYQPAPVFPPRNPLIGPVIRWPQEFPLELPRLPWLNPEITNPGRDISFNRNSGSLLN